MFGWLRRKFKKGGQVPVGQPVPTQEVPLETGQVTVAEKPAAEKPAEPGTVERKERICPKCGAPNDVFVDVCWLCKEKAW